LNDATDEAELRGRANDLRGSLEKEIEELNELKSSQASYEFDRQAQTEAVKTQRERIKGLKLTVKQSQAFIVDLESQLSCSKNANRSLGGWI
jgi:chromosome segregation ATPase